MAPKIEWPVKVNYQEISERLQTCLANRYHSKPAVLAESLGISEELAENIVYHPEKCRTLELISAVAEMCRQKRFSADWIFLGVDDLGISKGDCGICLENYSAPRFNPNKVYEKLGGIANSKYFSDEISSREICKRSIGMEFNRIIQDDYPSLDFIASACVLSKISLDALLLGSLPKGMPVQKRV